VPLAPAVMPTTAGADGGGAPRFDASKASTVGEEAAAVDIDGATAIERAHSATVELTISVSRAPATARVDDRSQRRLRGGNTTTSLTHELRQTSSLELCELPIGNDGDQPPMLTALTR
jgi:hypothetical protein